MNDLNRRHFLRNFGISAAALPFLAGLPSLTGTPLPQRRQRLIIIFSPNGTVPAEFWPDQVGEDFQFKSILKPLEPFKKQTLILNGIHNKVLGKGDNHMRGISCLLTADELLAGNIKGGSGVAAGWAGNISIDQEIKNFLQSHAASRTRFGSLEFGVAVPNRADPWTRMSYLGPNQPITPIDDPRQMFKKLYGSLKDKDSLVSVLDTVQADIKRVAPQLSSRDKALLDQHLTLVRALEKNLQDPTNNVELTHPVPEIDPSIELVNDNTPQLSHMQIDLMVNALANNMARVVTLQYMRSVGEAQMHWLGIQEGHHALSHEPDGNKESQEKLQRINVWFAGEVAYLAQRLSETPEPMGDGNMLDNTLILWTNELGKGNSHTLDNIPLVLIGGGTGFKTGRSLKYDGIPHNRLWLALAHAMGHHIPTFGKTELCVGGALDLA